MTSDQSHKAVLDAWATFAGRDRAAIAACFTPDAEWLAPRGNATATALDIPSHMIGADAIAAFLADDFRRMFQEVSVDFTAIHADGETVIVEETMTATLDGGRPYENAYCLVFLLKEGRIHRVREYMDTRKGWTMVFGEAA